MAEKLVAPVDSLTKMPLPVLPPTEIPIFDNPEIANWHHHYHPSNDRLLTSFAGLTIRHVRLQLLPIESHHQPYHEIFEGPILPKTNDERFGQIILACAGYIPSHAIDVHRDDPTESIPMLKKTRRRLQNSGEIEVRGQSNIRDFIKDHLVRQDFSHVKSSIIEEFLETGRIERKRFLGHWLLAIASELAVEPMNPMYSQALDEGLVKTPKSELPALVKSHVNGEKTSEKAIKALHKRLSKQRTGTLQTGVDELQLAA